jgi:hypothetical protein
MVEGRENIAAASAAYLNTRIEPTPPPFARAGYILRVQAGQNY